MGFILLQEYVSLSVDDRASHGTRALGGRNQGKLSHWMAVIVVKVVTHTKFDVSELVRSIDCTWVRTPSRNTQHAIPHQSQYNSTVVLVFVFVSYLNDINKYYTLWNTRGQMGRMDVCCRLSRYFYSDTTNCTYYSHSAHSDSVLLFLPANMISVVTTHILFCEPTQRKTRINM